VTAVSNTRTRRLREMLSSTTAIVYAILVIVLIVGAILAATVGSAFFTPGNIESLLTATTVLGFVTIGQTLVILVGSLDLSVPFVVSLSSVLAAGVMQGSAGNLVAGIVTALVGSVAIGIVNGFLVGLLKINGFIATLGVGLIVSGYLYTNYQGSTGKASPQLVSFGSFTLGALPATTLVMLVALVIVVLVLTRTRTGMHIYAVGGDSAVARMSGVRGAVPVVVAHALSGLFAGIAGLVIVARLGVGSPDVGSQGGYDLLSIAAVVLGGAVLAGGRGSMWGSLGGILIFATIDSVLGILQVNPYLKDVVRGAIIIIAVAVYARRSAPRRVARFTGDGR
jgi:ribose transport system permease protein